MPGCGKAGLKTNFFLERGEKEPQESMFSKNHLKLDVVVDTAGKDFIKS